MSFGDGTIWPGDAVAASSFSTYYVAVWSNRCSTAPECVTGTANRAGIPSGVTERGSFRGLADGQRKSAGTASRELLERERAALAVLLRLLVQQQRFEQQAGENRTLRRRIEQLSGQLRCLDADYRTLAETLRGPWS